MKRVDYYIDDQWDEDGQRIVHGKCIAPEEHVVLVTFNGDYPGIRIECPDVENCVVLEEGYDEGMPKECWLDPWVGNLGWEMFEYSSVEVRMKMVQVPTGAFDDGPTLKITGVHPTQTISLTNVK